jgi:hypothetical protein
MDSRSEKLRFGTPLHPRPVDVPRCRDVCWRAVLDDNNYIILEDYSQTSMLQLPLLKRSASSSSTSFSGIKVCGESDTLPCHSRRAPPDFPALHLLLRYKSGQSHPLLVTPPVFRTLQLSKGLWMPTQLGEYILGQKLQIWQRVHLSYH